MKISNAGVVLALCAAVAACTKVVEPKPEEIRPVRILKVEPTAGGRRRTGGRPGCRRWTLRP